MSKFDYVRFPRGEIVSLLARLEIAAVSERDLLHPSADLVTDLYTRLLVYLDFLHEEDEGQVEFSALEQLENPDLHMDSVRIMKLQNMIKQAVASVDCPKKFTLRDLIRPDPDRTELFISALLNYGCYRDEKINRHASVMEEVNALGDQQRGYEAKIQQLNAEIEEFNRARQQKLPLVQEVESKVKELRQTIASLNNHQVSLRTSIRKLKEKAGEMDEKISNAEFLLVQSVQENANLRAKIVQSPDKLQRALEEKKLAREEARNVERSVMQSFQEKTSIVEIYTKVSKKMTKHVTQMQTIQEQVNSAKSIEKEFKALKAKISDEKILDKSLDAKLVERQTKVQQLDELRKQLEKERDLKCEEATKEINNVKSGLEPKWQDLEARQKNVETVLTEVDGITSKTNAVRESGSAKQQELVRKYEEILKEVRQYSNSIEVLLSTVET